MIRHRGMAALLAAGVAAATAVAVAQTIETATVTAAGGERMVTLPGELLPFESVNLVARVAGYIETLDVDRGTEVTRGQVIATLVAPELAAQVAEARARVEAATAKRVEAESELVTLRSTFDRLKAASSTPGAVATLELQRAEESVKGAEALVESNVKAVAAATAALDAVKTLEGYLQVVAPFAGRVTERYLHPGALAGPNAGPIVRIEQTNRLRLVVPVPERQFSGVARGRAIEFTVPAFGAKKFTGTVSRVAGSLDARTRAMAVELDVNGGGQLAPGMFPDVSWPVAPASGGVMVPATSIVTTTERTFVIRVANGMASWVTVKKGAARGDAVEVTGALSVGDVIVKRATDEIHDGSRVK